MLCSKCGAENPAEARFCGKCGTPVTSGPPVIPVSAVGEHPATRPPVQKKSRLTPPVLVAGVVVIVLGITGLIALVQFTRSPRLAGDDLNDPVSAGTTMPPIGMPPSPSKSDGYNNAMNLPANAARPTQFIEVSDVVYAQKIVGTWRVKKFILGAFVDVECVYLSDGRASWSGTLTYLGQQTFLNYSGTWAVENGMLHTRIEASNVPQLIPVGMTGASKFVSLTDDEWIYVDLSDGQTSTAVRVTSTRHTKG